MKILHENFQLTRQAKHNKITLLCIVLYSIALHGIVFLRTVHSQLAWIAFLIILALSLNVFHAHTVTQLVDY